MDTFFSVFPLLLGMPESSTAASGGAAGGQLVSLLVTFGLIIVIFYFLIIRPQSKKQKETQKMLAAVKKGDRVVTVGGLRGTVHAVKDETIILRVDDNVKMEFNRSAVASILASAEGEQAPVAKEKPARGKAKGGDGSSGNGTKAEEGSDAAEAADTEGGSTKH